MSTITIPADLKAAFLALKSARLCDESGKTIGYFSTRREATEEDYEWAMQHFTAEDMEKASSGPFRPASEIIPELIRKYGL